MNQKERFLTAVTFLLSLYVHASIWTPTDFSVANLTAIGNDTTISFSSGSYLLTPELLTAWASGSKNNVTFQNEGSGSVIFDATGFGDIKANELLFDSWDNLKLINLEFRNVRIVFQACNNSSMEGLLINSMLYSDTNLPSVKDPIQPKKKATWSTLLLGGDSNTIKNCTIDWPGSTEPGMGLKLSETFNFTIENVSITGNLVSGMNISAGKKSSNQKDPILAGLVLGGEIVRSIETAYMDNTKWEDHGLYILNGGGTTVDGMTFSGWTDQPSGHGIKLKGVKEVEITNCIFKEIGGIIIREADNWQDVNENIWIHNNIFEDFGVNSFGLNGSPGIYGSCVIELNEFRGETENSGIKLDKEKGISVNLPNFLANKNGGIFNNCGSISTPPAGINFTGNSIDGCTDLTTHIEVTGVRILTHIDTLFIGNQLQLSHEILPVDATNQNIQWISNNPSIISTNALGVISAISEGTATVTISAIDGGHVSSKAIIALNNELVLSIEDDFEDKLTMFPNPLRNSDDLKLIISNLPKSRNQNGIVTITSMAGQLVMKKTLNFVNNKNTIQLSLPHQLPGTYVLRIMDQEENITHQKRFIIRN